MLAVAERLVFRKAAAAEPDRRTTAQPEFFAVGVDHREVPFNAKWTVIEYCDFCCHGSIVADTGRYNGRMRRVLIVACLLSGGALAQPPGIMLGAHARTKMQSHLKNQPNYICLETLERSQRDPLKKRTSLIDVLRFEVAFVDHKEMYAWPGSNRFEDTELIDMVPAGGTIGTGAFASHAYNLFLTNSPRILTAEWTELDGRRTARYPYDVSEMVSGYRLRVARGEWAVVGYHGSIWVDAEREEVVRIEVIADEIPLRLGLKEARLMLFYGDVKIGGENYWLPLRSTESTTTFGEHVSRNEGRFTACRQFVGESKLSFGDPPPEEAPPPQTAPTEVRLPEGLTIQVQLTAPIDSENSKTGDAIDAVLGAAIKQKKVVLFEKGSRVEGRLIRMQKLGSTIRAEIQFVSITSSNRRALFTAAPQVESSITAQAPGRPQFKAGGRVGSVQITIEGSRLTLLKGSRSLWTTVVRKDS